MAIRYVVYPNQRMTVGIMCHTKFDAINKINKMMKGTNFCFTNNKKYLMPSYFRVSTVCDPRDEYSEEEGKKVVKKKLLEHYYASIDKRVAWFEQEVKDLYNNFFVDDKEQS